MTKTQKVLTWLFASVLFALFPLGLNYLNGRIGGHAPTWLDLCADGEPLLIGAALTADAVSKLFAGPKERLTPRIVCAGFCLSLLLACSAYFASVASRRDEQRATVEQALLQHHGEAALTTLRRVPYDRSAVANDSSILFCLCVFVGFCAIVLEED